MNTETQDRMSATAMLPPVKQCKKVCACVVRECAYQAVVFAGGGEYQGIQRGELEKGIPDLVLFNDPATHTTLALAIRQAPITASVVHKKIARSRQLFVRNRQRI